MRSRLFLAKILYVYIIVEYKHILFCQPLYTLTMKRDLAVFKQALKLHIMLDKRRFIGMYCIFSWAR